MGEHEEEHLQFESEVRNRINRLRKQAAHSAESSFDLLPIELLYVLDIGRNRSLRVFLPVWKKLDVAGLGKDVLGKRFGLMLSLW